MVTLKFSSLEEVNKRASDLPDLSVPNHEAYWKSMRKLLDQGTKEYNIKDRENAYIHLFRFFEMFHRLKERPGFKKNESKFYGVIGGKDKLCNAMNLLEELKNVLSKEYEALRAPTKIINIPIKREIKFRDKISVMDLMRLRDKKEKEFLLCEVRHPDEYLDNHVNWDESILIPPGVLRPDIIPKNLEGMLPEISRTGFAARRDKDYIIFMDNCSETVEDNVSLIHLKKILTDWEGLHVHHNILICEGGFDKFSMAYPLHTTKKMKSTGFKSSNASRIVDIKNLVYPEVDKNFKKGPSPSPPLTNSKSPAFSSGAISLTPAPTKPTNGSTSDSIPQPKYPDETKGIDFKPYVPDRSLKANIIKDSSLSYNAPKESPSNNAQTISTNGSSKSEEKGQSHVYPSIKVDEAPRKTEAWVEKNKGSRNDDDVSENEGSSSLTPIYSSQGSTINRSYSSPNIAQLADKEDQDISPSSIIPRIHVDRSTKPSSQIKRNFDHIWSSGQTKRGLTGLKNLGNTCYMNSILQCISNFTVMAKYFLEKKYINDINKKSETQGNIANEYSALLQQMWSGNVKSISPSDMKRVIGRYNSNFAGFDQQDAHEFFLSFMLWLHNDVNEIQEKIPLPEQKTDDAPSKKAAAKKAWDHELRVDKSFIRQTFYGQRKSTLKCLACDHESSRYDSFIELSLELPPGNRKVTLGECIKLYLDPVYVTWTCSKCKHNGRSLKKFDLVKLPLILTIHLARFFNDGLWRKKQNVVEFDLEHVDFGRYVTDSEEGTLNTLKDFSLYGVCNHFGSMEGGHYTAYCYSQVYSKWHKYDDHEVHEIDRSNVVTAAAYVLFYAAKN